MPRPAITTPAVVLGKVLPGSDIFNPILGSQIPEVAPQALSKPSSNKVVGNNVVLKVTAPAQSTVYIYRDGLLVKVVPSAAAQSIKIARNKVGKSSFQILIVDKNGKISISKKSTVRVTVAAPIVALSKVLPGSDIVNQVLGSSIPKVALRAVVIRSSSKVVGNNVVLKVTAPARSTVYIYRDGLLVKVIPSAAAQSIKIARNKVGKSSFQILIVDKNGKISISKKSTVRVTVAAPIVALSKVLPGSDIVNQVLGSSIPKVALRAVVIRSSSKVVGNNVVLKVTAPARSKVYIYRDGLLVKVVPATAAQSIKIAKNKVGKSSFQILIVDKNGKISISKKSTVRVRKASK